MIEIKAGPELDRAVAEASGMIYDVRDGKVFADYMEGETVFEEEFSPSTDAHAALWAASSTWDQFAVKKLSSGKYEVTALCDGDDGWSRFAEQPNLLLTICSAILAARGYDFMHGKLDAMGGLSGK